MYIYIYIYIYVYIHIHIYIYIYRSCGVCEILKVSRGEAIIAMTCTMWYCDELYHQSPQTNQGFPLLVRPGNALSPHTWPVSDADRGHDAGRDRLRGHLH